MTTADKQIVAGYMGWTWHKISYDIGDVSVCSCGNRGMPTWDICRKENGRTYDLNDAALCVEKMRNTLSDEFISDWHDFFYFACPANVVTAQVTEFFMNADNFFQAMAAWLRSRK